ncbi:Peptidyl-prolyl cis-trans isomerase FKBP15-2 [Tetrabaena socialis]|uniref:peptidylprolyl isomerase n=1 Tax=Tetrabaena socialis TaxID=47790 RepID=A0A2J8A7G2_9CHLO|nr:Peptidyl-prolyl cis-trans isomerase FKBP15-2 [Tetrabaena socialis]|eukprot:PNH08474.1 Peptidyl-prolyl cis-trans isomerase FKBP15-2 [Tetrabaena socialis]
MARETILLLLGVLAVCSRAAAGEGETVQIGVKFRPEECETKAVDGDYVGVHYVGKLADGTEFDNSLTRGEPIEFQLGAQQVREYRDGSGHFGGGDGYGGGEGYGGGGDEGGEPEWE